MNDVLPLTVSILTYNRRESLEELLEHLDGLEGGLDEIIVIDNGSGDGTAEMIRARWPRVRHLRNDRNVGVAARNLGLRSASGEIVITLDDDIVGLTSADLARVRQRFAADPGLGALNFRVEDYYGRGLSNWVHHRPVADARGSFDTYEITEGAVAFRRTAVAAAGYYHEAYFISHEGPDLAFRLMNAGYRVAYDGSIGVRHKHLPSGRHPDRFYYYDTRNQFLLAARNLPLGPALRYLARGQAAMAWYAMRDRRPGPWLRGVWDGLRALGPARAGRQAWTPQTAAACREIDRHRRSPWEVAWRRLLGEANRLGD